MWTGGFPEPLTFSLRARRHLRARRGQFDVVHDNQTLGYGLLGDLGAPLVTTIHHPITVDRQLELDAADGLAPQGLRPPLVRLHPHAEARRAPAAVRAHRLRHLAAGDRRPPRRAPATASRSSTSAPTPISSRRIPRSPRCPGRIVTTSSADVPLKGLVHLVEALAKLRTENPDAHLVVVGKRAEDGPVAQLIERYGLDRRRSSSSRASPTPNSSTSSAAPRSPACRRSTRASRCPPPRPWPPAPRWSPPPAVRSPRSPAPTARPAWRCRRATPVRWRPRSAGCWATRSCALRLGAAGRQRVLERFTWARAAQGTAELYREAMASHNSLRRGTAQRLGRSAAKDPGRSAAPVVGSNHTC